MSVRTTFTLLSVLVFLATKALQFWSQHYIYIYIYICVCVCMCVVMKL